ncbi:ethylbenzene dioxygenase beta subunit [Raineyella antarctica]|uniref:Ethylbenzene dioxygenase beta subunit n=1 Tax=Raineyella antarctica TaxID=1577474 RepID=A0A1G6H186_9ACTN|nr:aromatic-ring-hydroxylating dioxygenase subunit beta [Raineyella antarctica]SDB87913.1 ethylbenzene dioxygenase beta subunit [Raineyella antarctica]
MSTTTVNTTAGNTAATVTDTGALTQEQIRHLAEDFLAREAKLLDERRFDEWLTMIDDEIVYEVPIRSARLSFEDEVSGGGYRIRDDKPLLALRVARLDSGQAWAEVAPSRTLRVVGSVIVERGESADVVNVESALLLYRQRGHDELGDVIPVRRQDQLRLTADGPRLLRRTALLTTAILQTPNLGVFV